MLKQKPGILLVSLLSLLATSTIEAHFLWRINTEKPSYLYGTVHSSDSLVSDLPVEVIGALKSSASFHPELEFSPENIGRLTAAIFAGGTTDLSKDLPPPLWERLLGNAQKAGIPAALLRRIPLQLAPLLFTTPPNTDFNQILDVQLYQLAQENGLAMRQLETVDEQIEIFRGLGRKEALVFLEEALDEWENGFPTQAKILRLYRSGDLEGLQVFLDDEFARLNLPGLGEQLIDRRNHRMAERLLPHLKNGGVFAAVGVGHMSGDEGLIALLARSGFEATRLPLHSEGQP